MADVSAKGRKILVAVDESEESIYALSWCIDNIITGNSNDTLILLYSIPPRAVYSSLDGSGEKDHPEVQCVMEKAKRACKDLNGVKVETIVEHGDARDVICQAAEKLHVDMLVMGSHGYGVIKRAFLGSVSNHCAQNVKCPVLIVAPHLFVALSIMPFVSQISYVGQDRLMYSFYTEEGHDDAQTFAVFTNSSSAMYYSQPVNRDTGMLYGQPVVVDAKTLGLETLGWSKQSAKGTMGDASQSSIGIGLNKAKRELFFNTATMDGRAKIPAGFPVQYVDDRFSALNLYGEDFYLASSNAQVIVDTKIPHTSINVYNGTVSVQFKNLNGTHQDLSGNQSCKLGNGERGQFEVKIKETTHMFYCSVIQIAGLESVYTVAFNAQGMGSNVHKLNKQAYLLLVLVFVILVVVLCAIIIIVFKHARREMFLCVALIKQMELTNQAEKKSITKSLAFAGASREILNGFGNVTCRIDNCLDDATPELAKNLKLIKEETTGLLELKLVKCHSRWKLADLIEHVIDLQYHRAIQRGVDLILDPADDSLAKFRLVKGDSENYADIKLCTVQKGCCDTSNDFPSIQQNPNCMEFTFEGNDTGMGIPKEKHKYVFQNFVQVKEEKNSGEEGYGLGLGIVQSMVHLMRGEIKIVDKEDGERGTRFQFNIFLTTCVEAEEQENNAQNHGLRSYISHHLGMQFRSSLPRSDGYHVVLFLTGEKGRKDLCRLIGNMNIKVSEVRKINELVRLLDRIKRNLDLSSCSPDNYALNLNLPTNDTNEMASGTKDTHDHVIPHCKRSNSNRSSNVILIIIDSQVGHLLELSSSVGNFKKDLQNVTCKVVLLQDHVRPQENRPPFDYVFPKPLHGKRLHEVLRLLSSTSKDLQGKKVLVVDDQLVQRKYASKLLQKGGADVDVCENGKEAFDKVCSSLKDMSEDDVDKIYDFIMMDCEMPRMNGYQATRLIRKEEKRHGIYIPIIAVTGHNMDDETSLYIKEAGMDFP
ncbi:hypothetical protein RND71_041189 [Anisodus tanguticus]|uniref:histidine kinase n=1 Tax=Anisodus tanguticus TaxID=243964 RepID=A0AAE1UQX8_9SOLA|nr:hypothetical protein RND71_041189 [Anisodus tanguticus]